MDWIMADEPQETDEEKARREYWRNKRLTEGDVVPSLAVVMPSGTPDERYDDVPEYDDVYDDRGRIVRAASIYTDEELEELSKEPI